jgi:hypothetical protein
MQITMAECVLIGFGSGTSNLFPLTCSLQAILYPRVMNIHRYFRIFTLAVAGVAVYPLVFNLLMLTLVLFMVFIFLLLFLVFLFFFFFFFSSSSSSLLFVLILGVVCCC